ncbi:MAG TPA: GFA family protein [Kofleriaceae bacterium]|nr:GFA family protein [Kofleriaceae bacterium]
MTMHHGSCHCGAVTFEALVDLETVTRCNCTICTKTMWTGLNCKPDAFRLLSGDADLTGYVWGGKVSTRYFCKHCGVQCFGKGHLDVLGGDFVSINVNALEGVEVHLLPLGHWDGRHNNWQAGMRETPWPILRDPRAA